MCIGCRERREKKEMIRFVRNSEGALLLSESRNMSGKGFYLCPDVKCLKAAMRKKQLGRVVGMNGLPISLETRLAGSVQEAK